MKCLGACLPHCICPNTTIVLARSAIIYIVTSVVYLFITYNVGTPLKNSLTPKQIQIKKKSTRTRFILFLLSFIISMFITTLFVRFNEQIKRTKDK